LCLNYLKKISQTWWFSVDGILQQATSKTPYSFAEFPFIFQEKHRQELEENKSDMMMVLKALKSDSYQSSTMSNESLEMNDELKKLERHVETLKQEHQEEIERLRREHEQDLDQLRNDMVTLLRVQETYKTPEEGKVSSSLKLKC
jgi:predicted transcriptional regulator